MQIKYLGIDSNILVYLLDSESIFHLSCIKKLQDSNTKNYITQQNINECLNVLVNIYKQNSRDSLLLLKKLVEDSYFELISPVEKTTVIFEKLILSTNSKNIHDCYLSATLLSNGITSILTNDPKDFKPFTDLEIITP